METFNNIDFENFKTISKIFSNVDMQKMVEQFKYYEDYLFNEFKFKQYVNNLWNEFDNDIKNKRRFTSDCQFIDLFSRLSKEANCLLPKGAKLYRARKIDEKEFHPIINDFLDNVKDYFNDYITQKTLNNCEDIWDYISYLPVHEWENRFAKINHSSKILFWGFQEDGSDAPPQQKAIPGRANPQGIRHLYTSEKKETAISEIQPNIGQIISVATIEINNALKIFDFDFYNTFINSEINKVNMKEYQDKMKMTFEEVKLFYRIIENKFTRPSLDDTDNYYATQYLSECIRNLGFEGISYKSSVDKDGINLVLFDTSRNELGCYAKNYSFLGSSLHKIKSVSVSSDQILPKLLEQI